MFFVFVYFFCIVYINWILSKPEGHVPLNVNLYERKGKRCPYQTLGHAFKIKVAPADSSYIGIERPEDKS